MTKKLSLLTVFAAICMQLTAQNIQLHFDPRHALNNNIDATNYITATFEMFKPDKWGSTFAFVDFDFNQSRGNLGMAYWEIARDIKMGKCPIQAHIEYNGGVLNAKGYGISIPNAYLIGASYARLFGKLFMSTYITYKYNAFDKVSNDVQWTLTWSVPILENNKISFNGFVDFWTENKDRVAGNGGKKMIILAEPQLWYNWTSHLSLGTEIEVSNNFHGGYANKLYAFPTVAAKWNF